MTRVCVLQTDNRPSLHYLLKTQKINKHLCSILGYDYMFLVNNNQKYKYLHPATKKIHIIYECLTYAKFKSKYDVLVFLDSDAWIHNEYWLKQTIGHLMATNPDKQNKQGCFSRDPYEPHNTFINSGSFILKINEFTIQMYKSIIDDLYSNTEYHNQWPYDQYYISKYIFEKKDSFIVFAPDVLNTPQGKVLRHNWLKNKQMHDELDACIVCISTNNTNNTIKDDTIKDKLNLLEHYDCNDYPNKSL